MPHIRRTFRFCINRILEPNQPILLFWFMTCLFLSRRNMFHLFNLWFWFIFHVWHFITEIKRKKKKREMNESIYRHSCICNFDPPKPPCTLLKKEIEFRSCNIPIQSLTFSLLSQCGVNEVTIRWTSFLLLLSPPTHTHTPLYFYYKKRNNEIQFQPENTGKRWKETKKENFRLGVRKEKVGKSGMTRRWIYRVLDAMDFPIVSFTDTIYSLPFEWIPLIKICLVCAPHRFYFCLHLLIIRTGRDLFDSRHPFDACWQETQDHVDHEKIIRFPGKEIPRPNPGSNLFFTQPTGSKKGLFRVETLWKKRPCEKEREKRWSWNMILKK